jgi:PilZ domain
MRGRMPGWVSRADRTDVRIKALLLMNGRELPVTIIDMSQGGCKIICLHFLPIGEIVQLVIPAFQPSAASIRWSLPGKAGLRFI